MSAYERKYELKERDCVYVNVGIFQGPQVSRELVELLLLFTHIHTHTHLHCHLSLSRLSLCLIILLYPFLLHYWHFKQLTREHEACWQ